MYERVAANKRKSWALVLGFVVLVAAVGWAFGQLTGFGYVGLAIGVGVAVASSWAAYFSSDRIALAMSGAQPADQTEYQQLHNVVEALCLGAGLPKPRLYVVDDSAPNAFATGRNPEHAAVAVTTGLLEKMNRDELEGVLAHELSHIRNRDILIMTLAVTLVGMVVLLADWLLRAMWWGGPLGTGRRGRQTAGGGAGALMAVLALILIVVAPLLARILQFAISRRREFLADADAVLITRYPPGLIGALEKLRADQTVVRTASRATAHLWIESPIPRRPEEVERGNRNMTSRFNRLFDTHPPLDERIAALRSSALGGSAGAPGSPIV